MCEYTLTACMDSTADNYFPQGDLHDQSKCSFGGCTNPDAINYDSSVRHSICQPPSPPSLAPRASSATSLALALLSPQLCAATGHVP